jgi:hypothetical protein
LSKSLPPFSIIVTATPPTGTATLTWSAPTENIDGSMLTNLSGYRLYHGSGAESLDDVRTVAANTSSYEFSALAPGIHHFAISAYNSVGAESSLVYVGSKTIQ